MKILWVKSELLHPVDKGGKIRTLEMLKHLMKNHQVTYICLATPDDPPESYDDASEYCHELVTIPWNEPPRFSLRFYLDLAKNLVSLLPYAIEKYQQKEMLEWITKADSRGDFDVIVCDFLTLGANVPKNLRTAAVLFEHNVESILWERSFKNQTQPAKRAYFFLQYVKMWAWERAMCRRFDCVAAVSTNDAEDIRRMFGIEDVYAVPTGVDYDVFRPLGEAADPEGNGKLVRRKADLSFTGSMDWMPNEDGILYFAEEILPLIAAHIPDISVTVVGRNPTPKLQELAALDPRIELTGRVPDVRPYIERSTVYIVPLRVGGGTRIKIYEAMGMRRAVVSTSIGAEGLPVVDGEEIVLADEPRSFADEVVRLLQDDKAREKIEARARTAVVDRFGWNKATDAFVSILERALDKHRAA